MTLRTLVSCVLIATAALVPSLRGELPPLEERRTLHRQVEAELRENILPFWLEHARDRERGGFYGEIDGDLNIKRNAPRGALLTSRILWTFSAAYQRYRDPAYLEMARWAYDDLQSRFWDREHGGLYWRISADGKPLDARKILYVQAFGIYALSEFNRATGDRKPLDRAIELFRLVERHCVDAEHGGYFEELSRDWQVLRDRGARGSAMGSKGQKSQNVHLHLLEAYTNLLRAWPDATLRERLRSVADVMLDRILDAKTDHLRLFLDEDWTPRSEEYSFGHDIEFSWLMCETADVLDDENLIARVRPLAVQIAHTTLEQGVDPDGGVLGEANPRGLTVTFKEWWPQAEAVVGFLNAYQISGDPKLWTAMRRSWSFIETYLVDRKKGEWLHGVSRDHTKRSTMKLSFWKCPYHNGRACLQVLERLESLESKP